MLTPTPALLVPRLRVVVVCPSGQVGGAERWLFRLLASTDRLQLSAIVLGEGPLIEQWRMRQVPVLTLPMGQGARAVIGSTAKVRAAIKREAPDVVLANGVRGMAAALLAAWLDGTPVVWVKHDQAFDGPLTRLLARCSTLVAPSASVGRSGTGRDPVVVRPPRGDDMGWSRDHARRRIGELVQEAGGQLPEDALVAVVVGALIPLKGLGDAIAAIAQAERWHLVLIGAQDPGHPSHRGDLAEAARGLATDERVHLVGPVDEAATLMPGADALLQLTRAAGRGPSSEGYGMAVLEAACAGGPVICTPCPAADDLIDAGGERGVQLVRASAPDEVARVLNRWNEVDPRRAAGGLAQQSSAQHPTSAELAERLASTLATAAGRAGAGVPIERGVPVSVVAPLFAEGPHVAPLVQALKSQLRPEDEFVAVDDASPDDTIDQILAASAELDLDVRLVARETNGGVGAARNSGVQAARHDVIVFADAGTFPAKGWLDAMRAAAVCCPAPALIAGSYAVSTRDPWQAAVAVSCYPNSHPAQEGVLWRRAWHALFGLRLEASAPAGRSLAITRAGWEAIGGFDERRRAAEDVDAGQAMTALGHTCVLAGDALVRWDQAPTWQETAAMYRHYGRGDAQADHRRAVVRDVVRALAYPIAVGALLPGPGSRRRRAAVAAGGLAYLSLPLTRAVSQRDPLRVLPLVPLALAVKDLAKAWGAIQTMARLTR